MDNLHAAGVHHVMPYICSVTIGGHHVRRTGFWEFYDHWDEYLEFGLPPRPEPVNRPGIPGHFTCKSTRGVRSTPVINALWRDPDFYSTPYADRLASELV